MRPGPILALALAAAAAAALLIGPEVRSADPPAVLTHSRYLAGELLVAAPKMGDPRFARTVIYMIEHNASGAMGLVINRPFGEGPLAVFLKGFGLEAEHAEGTIWLQYGGPVELQEPFVLHTNDYADNDTIRLSETVHMSSPLRILKALAEGRGPRQLVFAFGYAGWSPNQLEGEIARDDWYTAPADEGVIFDDDFETKWDRAMAVAGVRL